MTPPRHRPDGGRWCAPAARDRSREGPGERRPLERRLLQGERPPGRGLALVQDQVRQGGRRRRAVPAQAGPQGLRGLHHQLRLLRPAPRRGPGQVHLPLHSPQAWERGDEARRRGERDRVCTRTRTATGCSWETSPGAKFLLFFWRLTYDSLPMKMSIKRKRIELDTRCPICWRKDEDGAHIFLKCNAVKQVWRAMDLEDGRLSLCECTNACQVPQHVFSIASEKRSMVIILLRDWWMARNKTQAGEKIQRVDEICFQACKHLMEFTVEATQANAPQQHTQHMQVPKPDFIKVNFNATFCQET